MSSCTRIVIRNIAIGGEERRAAQKVRSLSLCEKMYYQFKLFTLLDKKCYVAIYLLQGAKFIDMVIV